MGKNRHSNTTLPLKRQIDHTKKKVKSPQTNGICERFNQTVLNEFYRVIFRKIYIQKLRLYKKNLDKYIDEYNLQRTHQGKRCKGRTPMNTFVDGKKIFNEKNLEENMAT